MKEDLYDDLYLEEKEEKTDFKAVLFKYTIHWPWFVACHKLNFDDKVTPLFYMLCVNY